jgi:hypothetical protein
MTADAAGHATVITADGPAEVAAGTEFILTAFVFCPAGCDLSGVPIEVTTPDDAVLVVKSGACEPDAGDAAPTERRRIAVKAPLDSGEHVWRLSCAARESNGALHGPALVRVPVGVRPHETSLAVWEIPSPVVTGLPFAIKVGAKSAAGCNLAGMPIAVHDESGAMLATGALGDAPWPGTSALYWTELALVAPADAGMFSWSVSFDAAGLALPHRGASSRFSIAIARPPEHKLTVKVVERETATPVENALVRLGAYRAATGGTGIAELMLPKGSYDLAVWKSGYEAPTKTIAVDADLSIEIAVAAAPEENPDAAWLM